MVDSLDLVGQVETRAGSVEVWRVEPTYPLAGSEVVGYLAVVSIPSPSYQGPRIPMAVTVHDPSADPGKAAVIAEDPDLVPPGKWDGVILMVDDVYADQAFRGGAVGEISAPVAVGQFLYAQGCFESHSALRSPAGDAWAERVGGDVPELLGRPTGDLEGNMRAWLAHVALEPALNAANQA